jgi:hypothetical protein
MSETFEYRDEAYFADVQELSAEGWRLHTAVFLDAATRSGRGWTYILERPRVEAETDALRPLS